MAKKKKTPPEVFERQTQNIVRLRQLLERNVGEGGAVHGTPGRAAR